MNELTVIDTDILIDAARKIKDAVDYLNEAEKESKLAASVVTEMELIVGCRNKTELQHTNRFLKRFQVLKITESISDEAINLLRKYRLSHGLAIPDALIAATAMTLNLSFVSKNRRDYDFISGLKLLPYRR